MVASSFDKAPTVGSRHVDRRGHRVAAPVHAGDGGGLGDDVRPQPIERKVERLEKRVTKLEGLPDSVGDLTAQFLQLRGEMGSALSAVRGEIQSSSKALSHEIGAMYQHTMNEMLEGFDGVRRRFDAVEGQVRSFRDEVLSVLREIQDRLQR